MQDNLHKLLHSIHFFELYGFQINQIYANVIHSEYRLYVITVKPVLSGHPLLSSLLSQKSPKTILPLTAVNLTSVKGSYFFLSSLLRSCGHFFTKFYGFRASRMTTFLFWFKASFHY